MTPPPPRVRVLVVDDSALTRKILTDMLKSAPEIEVVGTARDGAEAFEMAAKLKPDVITLDVEMPGMSGLEVLPTLLEQNPTPVIMVSALTQEGADVTLAALELGAVDFLPKPSRNQFAGLKTIQDQLVSKVLNASQSHVRRARRAASARPRTEPRPEPVARPHAGTTTATTCVLIGISTGGPQALSQTLPALSPPIPPVLVVQHMPAQFTGVFAARLDRNCAVEVKEAEEGDRVQPDRILIAPGGRHMTVTGHPSLARVSLSEGAPVSGHRPSIDMLFQSAAKVFGPSAVGILMTGMGRDGVEGCKRILAAGGTTYGQDEATSVVFGMNKAAILEGAIRRQFPLDQLPAIIQRAGGSTPEGP